VYLVTVKGRRCDLVALLRRSASPRTRALGESLGHRGWRADDAWATLTYVGEVSSPTGGVLTRWEQHSTGSSGATALNALYPAGFKLKPPVTAGGGRPRRAGWGDGMGALARHGPGNHTHSRTPTHTLPPLLWPLVAWGAAVCIVWQANPATAAAMDPSGCMHWAMEAVAGACLGTHCAHPAELGGPRGPSLMPCGRPPFDALFRFFKVAFRPEMAEVRLA
jgi:hypothetical protein